jgi:hypothetical protein
MTIDELFRRAHGLTESEAVACLLLLKSATDSGIPLSDQLIEETIYRINPAAGRE